MLINILAYPGMTMLDAVGPYEVLSRLPGARLQFVALDNEPITSDTGFMRFLPTCDVAAAGRSDVLLVPGGPPAKVMPVAQDPSVQRWLQAQHAQTRITASVCTGALILIAAGIVTQGDVSTHWEAAETVEEMGLHYSGKRFTRSGKVFMAAGVSAGIDLALVLCAEIADPVTAQAIQVGIEYDPEPPFPYGGSDPIIRQRSHDLLMASLG
ncbi:MAG: DJ-1/PfpI family protein [Pseudomonadales bacterium]|nr:DJ-1/PfpI family protein [Pseudomonadales bacterium]MCP5336572.1 DJ-1/PfpI family protein [Pseudomonadales bacterium]